MWGYLREFIEGENLCKVNVLMDEIFWLVETIGGNLNDQNLSENDNYIVLFSSI